MNIYVIKITEFPGYGRYDGFVVRAPTSYKARKMCQAKAQIHFWSEIDFNFTNSVHAKCKRIARNVGGKQGIILYSYVGD
jgi:hypothetical protein